MKQSVKNTHLSEVPLKKLSVTYHAPKGDSKMVEIFGHTFYDGKAEEVEVEEPILKRLQRNRFFECSKPTDVDSAKPHPDEKHEAKHEAKSR
jgi:hypothetical protein